MDLTIPQEVALLSYAVNRRYSRTADVSLYLVAAAVTQLLLERRACLTEDRRLIVVDHSPTKSLDLNYIMGILGAYQGHRKLKEWIQWFYNRRSIRARFHKTVLDCLVQNNAMSVGYEKRLFRMRRIMNPSLPEVERIVERIRAELLEEGPVERRTAALALILASTHFLRDLFSKYESDRLRIRIDDLRNRHAEMADVSKTVKSVLDEIMAAGVAAAMIGGTSG